VSWLTGYWRGITPITNKSIGDLATRLSTLCGICLFNTRCSNSSGYITYSKLHQMVSKDLFLRVHHITSYWRVLVLDWIRQLLRNHAPFDVTRRLQYTIAIPGSYGIGYITRPMRLTWVRHGGLYGQWMRPDGTLA
jgi:hypothetical protein